MTGALVAGLLAGYGVAVPVGAIAPLLIGLTARTSLRVGAAAALGVATADGLYALAAVLGGAAIAGVVRPVAPALRLVAAVVLVGVAARIAIGALRRRRTAAANAVGSDLGDSDIRDAAVLAGRRGSLGGTGSPARAYLALLGLTVLNPGTIVYFGALVLGRQSSGAFTGMTGAVFVAAGFAASASWQLLLAGTGAVVGRLLTGPRGQFATALSSSAVITFLAVSLAVSG